MKKPRRDYLGIVEAIYAPATSDSAWLQEIVNAALPALDLGQGVAAYRYDMRATRFSVFDFVEAHDDSPPLRELAEQCVTADPELARLAHSKLPRVETSRQLHPGNEDSLAWQTMEQAGFHEGMAIKAHDVSGFGCAIAISSARPIELSPRTRGALERIAAHLSAGLRLRQHADVGLDDAPAIFSPDGKLEHVNEVGSRALLESAIARRNQGLKLRRQDPEQALDLWRALVSGRWSLVDHVDRDGKRFVLARRNPPNVREPSALTPNERAVAVFAAWGMTNKLIAYELGLAPSTVSGLLATALRKLRLRSRTELCAMLAGGPIQSAPSNES